MSWADNIFQQLGKGLDHLGKEINKEAIKAGDAVGKGVDHLGVEINKEAIKAGDGLSHLGVEINKGAIAAGDGINHFGKEVEKEFCDLMTGGAYKRGEAGCGTEAGVGKDKDGFYTYNPQLPDTKYRGKEGAPVKPAPSAKELDNLARALNNSPPMHYEYEFSDAFGIKRFLPPSYKFGVAWPPLAGPISTPTRGGVIRARDREGGGGFLSLRADKKTGTLGFHGGEDYVAMPNERIYAPVTGEVVKLSQPGKKGLTGVEIKTANGYHSTVFYVAPTKEIQRALIEWKAGRVATLPSALKVTAGETTIGYAQDLRTPERYGPNMTNHVHVTLKDHQGLYVAPSEPSVAIRPNRDGKIRTPVPK